MHDAVDLKTEAETHPRILIRWGRRKLRARGLRTFLLIELGFILGSFLGSL